MTCRGFAILAGVISILLATVMTSLSAAMVNERNFADPPKRLPKPTLPKGRPAEQVRTLIRQYDQAAAEFTKRYNTAVSEAEQQRLFERYFPDPNDYAALLVEIAEQNPKDPAALDALLWAGRHARQVSNQPASPFARAKKALVRDYLDSPKIGAFCMAVRFEDVDLATLDILRHVWTKNPDRRARAQAGFALATMLRRVASWPRTLQHMPPKQVASLEKELGKQTVEALRGINAAAAKKEADAVLVQLAQDKDYADAVADYAGKKVAVADLARRELFELRRLQPGQVAPEIVGEDIDGKKFRLSDYRGKVVLLDFWGHW